MLQSLLPFSRHYLEKFKFQLKEKYPTKNNKVFFINNNYFKIITNYSKNEKMLQFGEDSTFNFFVIKTNEKDNEFNHILNKKINPKDSCLAGIAKATLNWNNENIFCGKCKNKLIFMKDEIGKICPKCNNKIFPRLNPAIIVLVKKGDKILLTRKKEWKANSYGLVAGFIEYGETIEEAVQREVFEETGIKIENIKYIASQFWPFPYQLMLGFEADYSSGKLTIDTNELEEAKWFDTNKLPILPPKSSIARFLIEKAISSL